TDREIELADGDVHAATRGNHGTGIDLDLAVGREQAHETAPGHRRISRDAAGARKADRGALERFSRMVGEGQPVVRGNPERTGVPGRRKDVTAFPGSRPQSTRPRAATGTVSITAPSRTRLTTSNRLLTTQTWLGMISTRSPMRGLSDGASISITPCSSL